MNYFISKLCHLGDEVISNLTNPFSMSNHAEKLNRKMEAFVEHVKSFLSNRSSLLAITFVNEFNPIR
jgi:hypothetical protein